METISPAQECPSTKFVHYCALIYLNRQPTETSVYTLRSHCVYRLCNTNKNSLCRFPDRVMGNGTMVVENRHGNVWGCYINAQFVYRLFQAELYWLWQFFICIWFYWLVIPFNLANKQGRPWHRKFSQVNNVYGWSIIDIINQSWVVNDKLRKGQQ